MTEHWRCDDRCSRFDSACTPRSRQPCRLGGTGPVWPRVSVTRPCTFLTTLTPSPVGFRRLVGATGGLRDIANGVQARALSCDGDPEWDPAPAVVDTRPVRACAGWRGWAVLAG